MKPGIRYQIFVSSTFVDLKEERQEIMQCLLKVNCIPAGMELFPAADDGAWRLIERTIDQSDYYVLVIGGRYGSLAPDGLSYTEREYDFAVSRGKRVLCFLHANPEQIPFGKSDVEPAARDRLIQFREKVRTKHHCQFWRDPKELSMQVLTSLIQIFDDYPAVGWVRGDQAKSIAELELVVEMKDQIAALTEQRRILEAEITQLHEAREAPQLPAITRQFQPFYRKVKLEFEAETWNNATHPDAAAKLLDRAHSQLVEFAGDLDSQKHPGVYHQLVYATSQISEAISSNPFRSLTGVNKGDWARMVSDAIRTLGALMQAIEVEKWQER